MDYPKLLQKIEVYKQSLTFPQDKRTIEAWERTVKGSIVRAEVAKTDGVKELLTHLKDKIQKANFVLQQDRSLTLEERNRIFDRKDEQMWLISFFEDAEKVVEGAQEKIDKDLEDLNK